jgi:hypothetical protein
MRFHSMPARRRKGPHPYRNIFTLERLGKLPLILMDGTSIEFPVDWTKEAAQNWRECASLQKP